MYTHTALSSVRLHLLGENLTLLARLAEPSTTQQLVGTDSRRDAICTDEKKIARTFPLL